MFIDPLNDSNDASSIIAEERFTDQTISSGVIDSICVSIKSRVLIDIINSNGILINDHCMVDSFITLYKLDFIILHIIELLVLLIKEHHFAIEAV